MKKLLIVSSDVLGQSLKIALADHFDAVVIVGREKALEAFLQEEPSHVMLPDMMSDDKDKCVYEDLQSANVGSRIIRYGLDDHCDLRLPADLKDILEKLENK
jgi:hypothetical protein